MDETSSRKGHSYITTGVDMDERRVTHATEGKGADTMESIKDYLEIKQTPSEQISQVCIDLSPAFISGVECYFPDAQITFDRFHVKALGNKAMDEVRKSERRRHVELKGHKYTFLKSAKQLTEAQSVQRHALVELYPTLGEAYRLKELFDDFWTMKTPQEARGFLAFWCDIAQESEIASFMAFVKTLKKHWDGILNYITSKLTNGILQGMNSKDTIDQTQSTWLQKHDQFYQHDLFYLW